MHPATLLKLSQSKVVRVIDYLLPFIALGVAAFYFFGKGDNGQAAIWAATAVVSFLISVANVTKLMHKMVIHLVANRA